MTASSSAIFLLAIIKKDACSAVTFENINVSVHVILILSFEGEIDSILILFIVMIVADQYLFVLFVLLLYVPSQQLWSLRDGQFTQGLFSPFWDNDTYPWNWEF